MKKILCFIITLALITSATTVAFAKPGKNQEKNKKEYSKSQEYEYEDSKVIKYSRYLLPIDPITKGMGATVSYDKATAVLTVKKDTATLVIDFKNKKVTLNGVEDTKSGIFTAKNSKKRTVLIKYIANVLGVRVKVDDDKVKIERPDKEVQELEAAKNIKVTPFGANVVANTLNSTTLYFNVTADIKPEQATGGKAELYVNSKLVASTTVTTASGSSITFTTSDGTPTNEELRTLVPEGGEVTIKLYNAQNKMVQSKAEAKLTVDYVVPTLTSVTNAIYHEEEGELYLVVAGAGNLNDTVDVTKLTLYDVALGRSYQLTTGEKGSKGTVISATSLMVSLGENDRYGIKGFGTSSLNLTVAPGSLVTDKAGNVSSPTVVPTTLPVITIQ
jgi:hypothetical protein